MTSPTFRVVRGADGVETFHVENLLKGKADQPGGMTMDEMTVRAGGVIARAVEQFVFSMEDEIGRIAKMSSALDGVEIPKERFDAVYGCAHDIKGQGGTFGYPLLTEIAGSLCKLIETLLSMDAARNLTPLRKTAVDMHVRALQLVHANRLTGQGGDAGRKLIDGLRAVVAKAVA